MSKRNIILLCLLFVLIITTSAFYLSYVNTPSVINGTYLSDDNVFLSIVFDNRDGEKFYYYHMTDTDEGMKQVVDEGTYEKIDENKYIIKSTLFDGITIEMKRDVFTLSINNVMYTFEKWSDTPGYIDIVDYDLQLDEQNTVLKRYERQLIEQKNIVKEQKVKIENLENTLATQIIIKRGVDLVPFGNDFINTYHTGGTVLEDGVVYVMEYYNPDKELIWMRAWNWLQVSELSTWSDYTIRDGKLYIVVTGQLNCLDIITGDVLFTSEPVGRTSDAPMISDDGLILIIGQYEPYLTAISPSGEIAWQVSDELYTHAFDLRLSETFMELECLEGIFKFDYEGNLLEEE